MTGALGIDASDGPVRVHIHVMRDRWPEKKSKGKNTTIVPWSGIYLSVEDGNAMKQSGHRYRVGQDDKFIVLRGACTEMVGGKRDGEEINYDKELVLHLRPAFVAQLASFAAQEGLL